ncbi:MAG: aminotransferase class I/II-fold pyridoxal phosphate-dependent enzyme [Pseudomonadota bacterium]
MKLPRFELERYFARHEFSARKLLCCSDCETITIKSLLNLEKGRLNAFLNLSLGYTEAEGAPGLRKEIARLYRGLGPENILVHAGAEEAIFTYLNVVLAPGDHAAVVHPCYQSLSETARGIGAEVSAWPARPENQWRLDLADLKKVLRPNTKAVVVNSPHNPTGAVLDAKTAAGLAALADAHGFLIFSDEVYRFLEYEPPIPAPSLADLTPRATALGVMSKSFGLAGLRIGWAATQNRDILEKMAGFKDYLTICNPGPSEFLAETALVNKEVLLERNRRIIGENLALLDVFFAKWTDLVAWNRPQAGPIGFPIWKGPGTADDFCRAFLEESGTLLLPGNMYGREFDRHFRLGFGRKNMPAALACLDDFLEKV